MTEVDCTCEPVIGCESLIGYACGGVPVVKFRDSDILFVRTERTLAADKYHEIRDKIEDDLRHAGVNSPRVVVLPPHLDISILDRDAAEQ
ncbi:hypothetical protein [Pseudaminobacter sp. NGMCC 1.201702]|uniref:hypothetical protein n=1 Tax=Pseudaminobacter sp. NGMCC 1.201702 TaxID=3391825 RepID=UPI0039EE03DD